MVDSILWSVVLRRVRWLPVLALVMWFAGVVLAVVDVPVDVVGAVVAGGIVLALLARES